MLNQNPASDIVYLPGGLSDKGGFDIRILDILGNIIFETQVASYQQSILLSDFIEGIYLVQVRQSNKIDLAAN